MTENTKSKLAIKYLIKDVKDLVLGRNLILY